MPQKTNHIRTVFILFPGHLKQPSDFLVRCPWLQCFSRVLITLHLILYVLMRHDEMPHSPQVFASLFIVLRASQQGASIADSCHS